MNTDARADIAVVGGGIAGLACAVLLAQAATPQSLRVVVVERQGPPGPELPPDLDLRVLAISPGSRLILEACNAFDLPPQRVSPYRRMRVWSAGAEPRGSGGIWFDAAELGAADLGAIVEQEALRSRLWSAAERAGVEFELGLDPQSLAIDADRAVLTFTDGRSIAAALVIGADGASSWIRDTLAVPTRQRGYGQHAIVAHVASERPHEATAWQCFQPGGPVALLPLADGRSSIVWSLPDAEATRLLGADAAGFERELTAATGNVLGSLKLTTARRSYPLAARHARRYTGLRFALIGDAAHQVHPLAGQGTNLALFDAAALAETISSARADIRGADPGDPAILRRFERWRRGGNTATLATMDMLHTLFSGSQPGLPALGALGLDLADRLPGLKSLFATAAIRGLGRPPRAAQSVRQRTN